MLQSNAHIAVTGYQGFDVLILSEREREKKRQLITEEAAMRNPEFSTYTVQPLSVKPFFGWYLQPRPIYCLYMNQNAAAATLYVWTNVIITFPTDQQKQREVAE